MSSLLTTALLSLFMAFATTSAFSQGHGSHGHCLKKVRGKMITLKRVKSKSVCKKRKGEWHTDDDGHDHDADHDHGHDHNHD